MRVSTQIPRLLLCLLAATFTIADDSEHSAFEQQLRSLEAPLKVELQERGLADIDAQSAAKQAVDELIRCSAASDEYSAIGSKNIIVRLGGKTTVTPETSCIYEFLELAGVPKR